jgi:transcriptional regulator
MYTPPAFKEEDPAEIRHMIQEARLSVLVTATLEGPIGTPLPLIYDGTEGEHGAIHGHLAKANRQWQTPVIGEALAIFTGPDAYVTPSWYAAKREHGKVVPTWNYLAVHAYGAIEFFHDAERLRESVTRLTALHESEREKPWAVADAPETFIASQLKGIVGFRLQVTRLEGKRKLNQNRSEADRVGVRDGLSASEREMDREIGKLIRP